MTQVSLSSNEKRVLSLMRDGQFRTTRDIIIHTKVTDGSREVRRLIAKGFNFVSEWRTEGASRYKVWRLRNGEEKKK